MYVVGGVVVQILRGLVGVRVWYGLYGRVSNSGMIKDNVGLANRVFFDMISDVHLQMKLFPCSSAVEQSPVKRLVVGSIPTGGAL